MTPLRIAIVSDTYYPATDGVIRFVEQLALQLRDIGHQVTLVIPEIPKRYYPGKAKRLSRVNFVFLKCFPVRWHGYFWLFPNFRFVRAISNADLVIINSFGASGIYATPLAKFLNKPIGLFIHHDELELIEHAISAPTVVKKVLTSMAYHLYRMVDFFAFATEKFHKKAVRFGANPRKMFKVNFGHDPANVTTTDVQRVREKYDIPAEKKVVAYLGRLSGEKNLHTILNSMRQLSKREDTVCVIAGVGYMEKEIRTIIKEENLSIIMTGKVPEKDLGTFYTMADILLTPTIHETLCFTVVEAMSYGAIPVINGRYEEDPLDDSNAIRISDIKDVEEIVQKVSTVLDNSDLGQTMKSAVLETAVNFTWKSFGKAWQENIEKFVVGASLNLDKFSQRYPTTT